MTLNDIRDAAVRISNAPQPPGEFIPLFQQNASKHGWFSWHVLAGIAYIESNFKPSTPNNAWKCGGMMQIMDGNMAGNCEGKGYTDQDKFDAAKSVEVAANMLSSFRKYFDGATGFDLLFLCVSAYNSGPGACIAKLYKTTHDAYQAYLQYGSGGSKNQNHCYAASVLCYAEKIGCTDFGAAGAPPTAGGPVSFGSLERPYPWESDSDIYTDEQGKMYSKNNLGSGIKRFTITIGMGGGGTPMGGITMGDSTTPSYDGGWPRWIHKGVNFRKDPWGICNWRDLGGIDCGGKKVRFGKLYRGSECYYAKEEAQNKFKELGITGICNLKGVPPGGLHGMQADEAKQPKWWTGAWIACPLRGEEKQMVSDAINFVIKVLSGGGAVYYHCNEGRNRTASLTSYILTALGASNEQIKQENNLSAEVWGGSYLVGSKSGLSTDQINSLKQLLL